MNRVRFLSKITLAASLIFSFQTAFSQNGEPAVVEAAKGEFTDTRDGKEYKYVKIGSQVWMAKNLDYNAEGSKCYQADTKNCEKYGRLYNWDAAVKACPVGWRLPTNEEWDGLNQVAVKQLKAKDGWNNGGNGEDKFEFAALPGGYGTSAGFFDVGVSSRWWSASEYLNKDIAYNRYMYYDFGNADKSYNYKSLLFSVRCVTGEFKEQKEIEENKDNLGFSDYALYEDNPKNTQENIENETNVSKKEEGLKFGIRAGFGSYRACFSDGCSLDTRITSYGVGFGGGLVIKNLPFTIKDIVSPSMEFNLFYRNTLNMKINGYEASINELTLSVPLMARIEKTDGNKFWNSVYAYGGFQLDIPLKTKLTEKPTDEPGGLTAKELFGKRALIDYGYFGGSGYYVTESIALDIRLTKSLTSFGTGGGNLTQIGFGLSIFF